MEINRDGEGSVLICCAFVVRLFVCLFAWRRGSLYSAGCVESKLAFGMYSYLLGKVG